MGIQYRYFPRSAIPDEDLDEVDYYALRFVPSFGTNGFSVREARIDISFPKDLRCVAHDYYPRIQEETTESEVEIALNVDLVIVPVKGELKYRKKLRRIKAVVVPGGLVNNEPWWKFRRRSGQAELVGHMDLLLIMRVPPNKNLRGQAKLRADLHTRWRNVEESLPARFKVPPQG